MARDRSGSGRGAVRTLALVAAVLVALASTAAVVLSDDPETLRLAVVGALWAFVLATFSAPRRREPEPADGAAGAAQLRRTYEAELEKEVAARREYELQLEVYLRRELERGLAADVAALRDEIARLRAELGDRLDGGYTAPPAPPVPAAPVEFGSGEYGRPPVEFGSGEYGRPPVEFGSGEYGRPPVEFGSGEYRRPPVGYTPPAPQYPAYPAPRPDPAPPAPAPKAPAAAEPLPRHRRRARREGEDNEVMTRLLGR